VPDRRRRRRTARGGRRGHRTLPAAALIAAVLGTALLALAVPRAVGLALMGPAGQTLGRLERRVPVEAEAIEAAIEAALAAGAWRDAGSLWQRLARLHLARLRVAGPGGQERLDALLQAESALERGLARRPGDAVAWWRLAWVANTLGRADAKVGAALRLSVVTGSGVAPLFWPRLRLALAKWPRLDAPTRDAFRPQLVRAMQRDPRRLVALARRSLAEDHVRQALRRTPALLVRYDRMAAR